MKGIKYKTCQLSEKMNVFLKVQIVQFAFPHINYVFANYILNNEFPPMSSIKAYIFVKFYFHIISCYMFAPFHFKEYVSGTDDHWIHIS